MGMPTIKALLPDVGAQRCIEMLRFGSDSEIESVWAKLFYFAHKAHLIKHEIHNQKCS